MAKLENKNTPETKPAVAPAVDGMTEEQIRAFVADLQAKKDARTAAYTVYKNRPDVKARQETYAAKQKALREAEKKKIADILAAAAKLGITIK